MRAILIAIALTIGSLSAASSAPSFEPPATVYVLDNLEISAQAKAAAVEDRMYGMTGLLGRLLAFSTGVDVALRKVNAAYPMIRVYPRSHWQKQAVYESAKANYRIDRKPIFLIGHSLGADAAMWVAWKLKADGIPVATIFAMDPTPARLCVPDNVLTAIGWQRTYVGLGGAQIARCPGRAPTENSVQNYTLADGKLIPIENHAVIGPHTYVDDAEAVHKSILKHVGEVRHMLTEMGRQ